MNRKQSTDKCLVELRHNLEVWNVGMWIMLAFPTFWAFIGCLFMVFMELDEFPMPYMGWIAIICLPLAAIAGWFAWRTRKQINRDLSRRSEGEMVKSPTFTRFVGREPK
jgi:hypothetical protein